MPLLEECQKNFVILGISSNQPKTFNAKIVATYSVLGLSFVIFVIFFFFRANTVQEYANSAYLTAGMVMCCFSIMNIQCKSNALFAFIDNMETVFMQKFESAESNARYERTHKLVEMCSKIGHFLMIKVTPVFWILFPKAAICYFNHFATDIGNDVFVLPSFAWYPFDWKNPFGYLIVCITQYITALYAFMIIGTLGTFGFGCFLYNLAAIDDTKVDLKRFNDLAKFDKNRCDALSRLGDSIQFYGRMVQFDREFMDIYQPIFFMFVMSSIVQICGVLLYFQIELSEMDVLLLLLNMIYALYAFGIIFAICELGQRLTNAYAQVSGEIGSFEWHSFSHDIQRILPIILLLTQKPIELNCFGSITCVRPTFKKIVSSAFSYFLTIRTLF